MGRDRGVALAPRGSSATGAHFPTTTDMPQHLRMAVQANGIPLVASRGLSLAGGLKVARWKGRLNGVRTGPRPDYHTICHHFGGARVRRLDRRAGHLYSGMHFVQPGLTEGHFESAEKLDYYHLYVKIEVVRDLAVSLGLPDQLALELPEAFGISEPHLSGLIDACIGALFDEGAVDSLLLDQWAQVFGTYLLSTASVPARARLLSTTPLLDAGALETLTELIESDLNRDLSLRTLSEAVHLSQFHFARAFKATTGQTPHRFIIGRRIDRACQLLRTSMLPLSAIAYDVGFSSQSHMTVAFKKHLRRTPGQVRKQAFF
ncbi:MAG: AraC family transcriptional regulator [Pseudomonadota bacterium]